GSDPQYYLGQELEARRQYNAALACYRQGSSPESHAAAAAVLIELGRVEEAVYCLRRALRQQPCNAEFHRRLARCWVFLGEARKAERHFRRALEIEPSNREARSGLLVALHYTPEFDPAQLYSEHLEWGRRQEAQAGDAARDLPRVGYVSPVFRGAHPIS